MKPASEQSVGRARRGGFTLTELIVAIGAVLLVSLGVGQIFTSVGRLTSVGRASAEIDAMARQIEQRLREDFEGFARMRPEETFMAIRMREIGDISRDGDADDPGERPIYLVPEDLEADQREGLLPYEILYLGTPNEARSKAVTSRLDEIVFLARAPEGRPFVSQQLDPARAGGVVTAPVARIYWGHALRPRLDEDFVATTHAFGGVNTPFRQYTPDGDFGMPVNGFEQYTPGDSGAAAFVPRGRNRFAGSWALARQPMLLYGGLAAGHPDNSSNPAGPYPIGVNREFAPFLNDLETLRRYRTRGNAGNLLQLNPLENDPILWDSEYPDPQLITWGRVDICAQDERDVRRWYEGQGWYDSSITNPSMPAPAPASAFGVGFDSAVDYILDESGSTPQWEVAPNGPLYTRETILSLGGPPGVSPEDVADANLKSLRSAIAGSFTRLLADDALVRVNRMPGSLDRVHPEDVAMDLHAILSTRCSNFEIAWSDGRRAVRGIDYDVDPLMIDEIQPGELIWFDIRPSVPSSTSGNPFPNITARNTFEEWRLLQEQNPTERLTDRSFHYTPANPCSEIPGEAFNEPNDYHGPNVWSNNVLMEHAENNNPGALAPGVYSTAITGGERAPDDPEGNDRRPIELLAIWGFRLPTGDGGYGAPWPKPAFIRVRMTLHDEQFRIEGGKTYEFIFSLRPDSTS